MQKITPLRQPSAEQQEAARQYFAELALERERREKELPKIREEGVAALTRLLKIAQGHSGQCRHVAAFLLSLYNGRRFKMDLTDFRCVDREIFDDCMAVLKMDNQPAQEVHTYFKNGGRIWEQLATDWDITDYTKLGDGER